jgi:hypothetical protein
MPDASMEGVGSAPLIAAGDADIAIDVWFTPLWKNGAIVGVGIVAWLGGGELS